MTVYYEYGRDLKFINAYPDKETERGRYVRLDGKYLFGWSVGADSQTEVLEQGGREISEAQARRLYCKYGWTKKGTKFAEPTFD